MERQQKAIEELKEEAQFVGEEGDMVVAADNAEKALEMFKKLISDTEGPEDAAKLKLESVGIAYLHMDLSELPEEYFEGTEMEWHIDLKKVSPYTVYFYPYSE
jgi:hypothetical protein